MYVQLCDSTSVVQCICSVSDSTYTLPLQNRSPPAKKQFKTYRDEHKPGIAGMVQVLSISWFFFIFLSMVVLMLYLSECRSWDPYQYPRIYWRADLCTDLCIEQKATRPCYFSGVRKGRKIASPQHLKRCPGLFWDCRAFALSLGGSGVSMTSWHGKFFGCL